MWIEAVEFGGGDYCVSSRSPFGTVCRPGEHPVFASESQRSDAVFNEVVVDLDFPIVKIDFEFLPVVQCVSDSLRDPR